MFSRKKDSADISDKKPTFHVRYIGATETYVSTGAGCTTAPLQRLWDNAPHERYLQKVALQISPRGIYMRDADNSKQKKTFFPIEDISFCAADKALNERLFCWIAKQSDNSQLEAHAVLCSTKEKAEVMATVLTRAFHLAYKDWKAERLREERKCTTKSSEDSTGTDDGGGHADDRSGRNGWSSSGRRRSSGQGSDLQSISSGKSSSHGGYDHIQKFTP